MKTKKITGFRYTLILTFLNTWKATSKLHLQVQNKHFLHYLTF